MIKNRRKTVKEVKKKSLRQKKPRTILPEIGVSERRFAIRKNRFQVGHGLSGVVDILRVGSKQGRLVSDASEVGFRRRGRKGGAGTEKGQVGRAPACREG